MTREALPHDAGSAPNGATRGVHKTLALKTLLSELSEHQQKAILDLGPATGVNVAFFSEYLCRLHIADLFRSLRAPDALTATDGPTLDRKLDDLLPPDKDGQFNLILVWDLIDYLSMDQIKAIGERLDRLAAPGCLLYMMVSTRPQIPEQPRRYGIVDGETLVCDQDLPLRRQAHLFKEPELRRLLPGWRVDVSYILRNGMQEYVLIHPHEPGSAENGDV